jgi:hypothetical protein
MKSKRKATNLTKRYIKELMSEQDGKNRLRVFDFDDTLVITDAKIGVKSKDGTRFHLSSKEFAAYIKQPDDRFDYSEFRQLINPRAITWMCNILKNVYQKHGPDGLVILSARSTPEPIKSFLKSNGIDNIEIVALDDADTSAKVKWINKWITDKKLDVIEFFDDSHKYIDAVKSLNSKHPNTKVIVRHVIHTHVPTHGITRHYGTCRRR